MRESVGIQFASQLKHLRTRIEATSPHYVRCLKPNDELIPYNFDHVIIADQLRCAGVLEAIRVSRVGFPHRYSHHDFLALYSILCISEMERHRRHCEGRELCEVLVHYLIPLIQSVINDEGNGGNRDLIERDNGKNK